MSNSALLLVASYVFATLTNVAALSSGNNSLAARAPVRVLADTRGEIQFAHAGQNDAHGRGIIKSIDVVNRKITVSHEPISTLGWPAMTMDFAVAPSVDLQSISPGMEIEFTLDKTESGAFEIQVINPVSAN